MSIFEFRKLLKERDKLKKDIEIFNSSHRELKRQRDEANEKAEKLRREYNMIIGYKNEEIRDLKSNKNRLLKSTEIFRERNYKNTSARVQS